MNSLSAPSLLNESSAFSAGKSDSELHQNPWKKQKNYRKMASAIGYTGHITHTGLWWRADIVYYQSIPAIKSATCGILTHREMHQLIFTHSLYFIYLFPDILHYTPLKFLNITALFPINKKKKGKKFTPQNIHLRPYEIKYNADPWVDSTLESGPYL